MSLWLLRLLELVGRGAEALPIIIALGLIAGRRGNAVFILAASAQLLRVARVLGLVGWVWLPLSYVAQLLPYGAGWDRILGALFTPAGWPWLVGVAVWGAALAVLSFIGWSGTIVEEQDRYNLSPLRFPFFQLFLASTLFFVALSTPNWPGGGLPDGMGWGTAARAIIIHSLHSLFAAFCPAGALALILMQCGSYAHAMAKYEEKKKSIGVRWLAFWAAIGRLPGTIGNLGVALGLLWRGLPPGLSKGIATELVQIIFLVAGMVFWFWQLLTPRIHRWLAWAGGTCLGLSAGASLLVQLLD